jgi:hypothetical protein
MLTLFGLSALTFMMAMYALERRGHGFVAAFAVGCALSSLYGFLSGAWPFGIIEGIWTVIAARRWTTGSPNERQSGSGPGRVDGIRGWRWWAR